MPCRNDDFEPQVYSDARKAQAAATAMKAELDRVTALLCEAVKLIPRKAYQTPELINWAADHEIADKRRLALEQVDALQAQIDALEAKKRELNDKYTDRAFDGR